MPGGVPGADQYPAYADRTPRTPARSEVRPLGAPCLSHVEGSDAKAVAVSRGFDVGSCCTASLDAGRLVESLARSGEWLDDCPRFPGAGRSLIPPAMEGSAMTE